MHKPEQHPRVWQALRNYLLPMSLEQCEMERQLSLRCLDGVRADLIYCYMKREFPGYDICPACGKWVEDTGRETVDGRIVLTCGDAVPACNYYEADNGYYDWED